MDILTPDNTIKHVLLHKFLIYIIVCLSDIYFETCSLVLEYIKCFMR